jgi:hypothetical protein
MLAALALCCELLGKQAVSNPRPPDLVPEYHRARLLVVTSAGLIGLWWAGWLPAGEIPLVNLPLDVSRTPYVLAVLMGYGLVRLMIEWAQSERDRRRRPASRIDLGLTMLIAALATAGLVNRLSPFTLAPLPQIPWIPALLLVGLGIGTGELLNVAIQDAFLIRYRDEARRLALPRVPFAVRAQLTAFLVVVCPLLLVVILLSPAFREPLSRLWYWLLFLPAILIVLTGSVALLFRRYKRPDGTRLSFLAHVRDIRLAYDRHDAHYQIGGWDARMPHVKSALYAAAERGDTEQVRLLLQRGVNPNEKGPLGWTPLMIAIAQRQVDTARALLDAGADPNPANLLGRNALMFAARYGNVELVRALLDRGADPNQNDSDDEGALAAAARENHRDIVQLLLDRGADPTIVDREGRSPLDYAEAAGHGDVAAVLRLTQQARRH